MFRASLTALISILVLVITNDLNYHPVSQVGLVVVVVLLMYITKITSYIYSNKEADEEAEARRQMITRKDPLKIEDTDNLLKGYGFLFEDK